MNAPAAEAKRWISQAVNDLDFARLGVREGFYAQTCFQAQQAAEKALKALYYARGERLVVGHSVWQLLRGLLADHPQLAAHQDLARQLDQYYIPPRYPNGLPAGSPFEVFTQSQAAEAVQGVDRLLTDIQALLPLTNPSSGGTS